MEAEQQSIRMERELISLVVTDCHLLDEVGKELVRIQWVDKASEDMADALLTVSHDATPAQALLAVQNACAQAPTLLAVVMVETVDEGEKLYQARLLLKSLRVRDLERGIRNAKARMQGEGNLTPEQLDELFEKTVSMQKELVRLRNEAPGAPID